MWYRLAEEVYVSRGGSVTKMQPVCDAMTPEQHTVTKRLLEGWAPGKCEKEIAPVIMAE